MSNYTLEQIRELCSRFAEHPNIDIREECDITKTYRVAAILSDDGEIMEILPLACGMDRQVAEDFAASREIIPQLLDTIEQQRKDIDALADDRTAWYDEVQIHKRILDNNDICHRAKLERLQQERDALAKRVEDLEEGLRWLLADVSAIIENGRRTGGQVISPSARQMMPISTAQCWQENIKAVLDGRIGTITDVE